MKGRYKKAVILLFFFLIILTNNIFVFGQIDDFFGCTVSLSNDYAVIGAEGVDGEGAVYIYEKRRK